MIKKTTIYKVDDEFETIITISTTEEFDGVYFSVGRDKPIFISYKHLEMLMAGINNDFIYTKTM